MPNNNPAGKNSPVAFDQFTRQIPYGEKKTQGDLQRTVPVAGAPLAAPALNLPAAAQRAATRATKPQTSAPKTAPAQPPEPLGPTPDQQTAPPTSAAVWQQLTTIPGASPLIFEYAARAAAMEKGGQ